MPVLIAASVLAGSACAPITKIRDYFDSSVRTANTVTITRDTWGVPHIEAPTDAAVVFGMAWAQAEDNFWQIEEDYLRALGRAASEYGEEGLPDDLVRAAFEVVRLSREEYEREPPARKALWNAWAAGLNYYLRMHPEVRPRAIHRFEPWFPFALFRSAYANTTIDGVRLRDVVATPVGAPVLIAQHPVEPASAPTSDDLRISPTVDPLEGEPGMPIASNAWAVAPSRTASGHALLFQNPHVGFFGGGQRWEMHIRSGEGWHVSGFAILGTPMPRSGHNDHLGWTHTNTAADAADAWVERFDHESDPDSYRYGDGWRKATPFEATIDVNTTAGVERRKFRFLRTHRGPVIAGTDGQRYSVRIARFEDGGSLQQWYAMGRAQNLEEFQAALAATAFPISNTTYADDAGNIYYLHGNAVPRRDPRFDWTRPVDGADPATEWQDYHTIDELPHLLNPASGWIQNTNATPFLATAEGSNLDPKNYPSYMSREIDNARARISRRILAAEDRWTFDEWQAAAFDTRVLEAEVAIPAIIDEWERLGAHDPESASRIDRTVEDLRTWDQVSTVGSTAMTSFVLWWERMAKPGANEGEWPRTSALRDVVDSLEAKWGAAQVAWGDMNRLQRIHTSGNEPFDTAKPSLPIAGGPGAIGMVFNIGTRIGPDGKHRYAVRGHTWVGVVEFGDRPESRSIVTFGQSADPTSPHWFDQAALFAAGRFKPAWFTREEVDADAQVRYHPGDPREAPPPGGT
jgi:acyl-homoserine-lactone acylase